MSSAAQQDFSALADQARTAAPPSGQDFSKLADQARNGGSDPHAGFLHSLYDSTIGGAVGTLKTAIGTTELDDIAKRVKAGDYKGAALTLGRYVTQGPGGRIGDAMVNNSIDSAKQAGQDFSEGNYGKAAIHGVGAVPIVGPVVSRPFEQAANGDLRGAAGTLTGDALMLGGGKLAEVAAGPIGEAAGSTAEALRRKALRGGYTVNTPAAEVSSAAQTMGQRGIPLTQGGADKLTQLLNDLQQRKQGLVQQSGGKIDPAAVDVRAAEEAKRAVVQVNPAEDLRQIERVRKNFMANHSQTTPAQPASTILGPNGQPLTPATPATSQPIQIPLDEAEALKEGTYRNTYDAPRGSEPTIAAEKALARGLKEELESQIPELGSLNAEQAKLLNLQGILEKALNKHSNSGGLGGSILKNTFSRTGLEVGGATGLLSHNPAAGASAALLHSVLSDPVVQSRLAQAIDTVRRATPNRFGSASKAAAVASANGSQRSMGSQNQSAPALAQAAADSGLSYSQLSRLTAAQLKSKLEDLAQQAGGNAGSVDLNHFMTEMQRLQGQSKK